VILKYVSLIAFITSSIIYAKNIDYAREDVQTLVIPKGEIEISANYMLLNNSVDILNLRSKELSNSANFGSIGNLNGFNLGVRYGIDSNLMLNYKHDLKNITYLSSTMTNNSDELYLRYNIEAYNDALLNSGFSFDIGYKRDALRDFKLKNISDINTLIKRVLPNQNANIFYADGKTGTPLPKVEGYYANFKGTETKLNEAPYISMTNTGDDSIFVRILNGLYTDSQLFNIYIAYKYTKIRNTISTSNQVLRLAKDKGYDLKKILNRDESMISLGFNYSLNIKSVVYELGYKYNKMFRSSDLGYIDYNHILNANISYIVTKSFFVNIGAKLMNRQFNGEIPYLYNRYTDTTFDHNYGYADIGFSYIF